MLCVCVSLRACGLSQLLVVEVVNEGSCTLPTVAWVESLLCLQDKRYAACKNSLYSLTVVSLNKDPGSGTLRMLNLGSDPVISI